MSPEPTETINLLINTRFYPRECRVCAHSKYSNDRSQFDMKFVSEEGKKQQNARAQQSKQLLCTEHVLCLPIVCLGIGFLWGGFSTIRYEFANFGQNSTITPFYIVYFALLCNWSTEVNCRSICLPGANVSFFSSNF